MLTQKQPEEPTQSLAAVYLHLDWSKLSSWVCAAGFIPLIVQIPTGKLSRVDGIGDRRIWQGKTWKTVFKGFLSSLFLGIANFNLWHRNGISVKTRLLKLWALLLENALSEVDFCTYMQFHTWSCRWQIKCRPIFFYEYEPHHFPKW